MLGSLKDITDICSMTRILFEYTKIVPKMQTSTFNLFYIYSKILVASPDLVAIFSDVRYKV